MKLRNLQENSGSWRICDFYLLIVLQPTPTSIAPWESTGTTPWFPSAITLEYYGAI